MNPDDFADLFGSLSGPRKPKPEKGVQIHGKKIGDVYYVRADDVAALLEVNDVLPGIAAKLRAAVSR